MSFTKEEEKKAIIRGYDKAVEMIEEIQKQAKSENELTLKLKETEVMALELLGMIGGTICSTPQELDKLASIYVDKVGMIGRRFQKVIDGELAMQDKNNEVIH